MLQYRCFSIIMHISRLTYEARAVAIISRGKVDRGRTVFSGVITVTLKVHQFQSSNSKVYHPPTVRTLTATIDRSMPDFRENVPGYIEWIWRSKLWYII